MNNKIIFYATPEGNQKVEVLFQDETAWLSQKVLAELFGVQVPVITKQLKNIFASGELGEDSVVSILETTATDGKSYKTRFYNLDAIIAVGYRVNSYQATQFRIWATKTLKEFIIEGFVLDDERLKQEKVSVKTTSTNSWNGSGKSGQASGGSTRRSPISLRFRLITTGKRH